MIELKRIFRKTLENIGILVPKIEHEHRPPPYPNKHFNKIFGIGYPKTGSTSLAVALRNLGFNIYHDNPSFFPRAYTNADFITCEHQDWDGCCNVYQNLFVRMDQQYPNSKFILTIRPMGKWLESIQSWRSGQEVDAVNRLGIKYVKSLLKDDDTYILESYLSYSMLYSCISMEPTMYINEHQKHIDNVVNYFNDKPNQLLVLNLTENDKYQKICDFLQQPLPDIKYPHEKRTNSRYIP